MAIRKKRETKEVIDLTGPDGNAFFLLGRARAIWKQMGYDREEIEKLTDEMKSGDYEHLINTFDKHFGALVDLVR